MTPLTLLTKPELLSLAARAVTLEVSNPAHYGEIVAEIERRKKLEAKYLAWLSEQRM